ncbi:2,3,4,5-tetrahydropyridine-2,6-dicarboxylate N-succinyltransferase [Labeo rohita]|uniref:2,3,4,5-tetrahydropyridine-2,6-dicarboxylate N-succinyltransferase n=1 Tax=Labeo rohita TaxID=84645 RepID=A0ABQ8L7Y9_LABRO|nr:2,3,4,5-tetrahydropyridine-2,6-dicarboxylate N-succinyltransferase [Labeo rohita]
MVSEVLERWPALSLPNEVKIIALTGSNEFKRITSVGLIDTFSSSLHQHTPQLLKLYRARQGAFGKKMEDLLNNLDKQTSNIVNHRKQFWKISLCFSLKIILHCLETHSLLLQSAVVYLFGLIFALDFHYPYELKYTFEVIEKVSMEIGTYCSAKVQSLKTKLLL